MGHAYAVPDSQSDLIFASKNGYFIIVKFHCDNGANVNIALIFKVIQLESMVQQ